MPWSAAELGKEIRLALAKELHGVPEPVLVPLSGGVDSGSVLAVVTQDLGLKAEAVSFTLSDRVSRDALLAEKVAKRFGVRHNTVTLSTDLDALLADAKYLVDAGVRGKAAVECSWPMARVFLWAQGKGFASFASGSAADGHYGLSKKAMIHYRYPKEKFDEFRRAYFGDPDKAQVQTVARLAHDLARLEARAPYHSFRVLDVTLTADWDGLNKPRQKEPIRLAFPELQDLPRHTNLQLGDSGIGELFQKLAEQEGHKSSVAVFNRLRPPEEIAYVAQKATQALVQDGLF